MATMNREQRAQLAFILGKLIGLHIVADLVVRPEYIDQVRAILDGAEQTIRPLIEEK